MGPNPMGVQAMALPEGRLVPWKGAVVPCPFFGETKGWSFWGANDAIRVVY